MDCIVCKNKITLQTPLSGIKLPIRFKEGPAIIQVTVLAPGDKKTHLPPFSPICHECNTRTLLAAVEALCQS